MTNASLSRLVDLRRGDAAICSGCCALFAVVANRMTFAHDPLVGVAAIAFALIALMLVAVLSLHAYRCLGLFAWMSPIALLSLVPVPGIWPILLACSILAPLFALRHAIAVWRSEKGTWNAFRALPSLASVVLMIALVAFSVVVAGEENRDVPWMASNRWYAPFAMAYALFATVRFSRPALEWILGSAFETMYKIRGKGPGLAGIPRTGPCLVIANHGGFFDPVMLEAILPRPVTGMMTSMYYDRWFVKPLAKYLFRIIRVPDSSMRREAPELQDAVAALDRGECVLIFPEGWPRRKEELPLRRFGQGIWQILRERPQTPVIACWVEGIWGSYFSHKNGPPMTGKPFDFRLPVSVGISSPIRVPPETLADHWKTRFYLMNAVSEARSHLGLEPLPPFTRTNTDTDET